jgi:phage-related protein
VALIGAALKALNVLLSPNEISGGRSLRPGQLCEGVSMHHTKRAIQPALAAISWEGDSRDVLKEWPREIQRDFGMSLLNLQRGERPNLAARPMQSIGQGVFELKAADEAKWYRVIYLARIENMIYVLDSFTKDSRKTERNDLHRARARLAQVKRRLQEERTDAKRKSGK